jgi:hypothetical protein
MAERASAEEIAGWASQAVRRADFWVSFVNGVGASRIAEIGVYRGAFAARLLRDCPEVSAYYMVDPWRHLADWNKPANVGDDVFESFYREALERTAAHAGKRVVLRGTTSEMIDRIAGESLDLAYVDGDHTLRGITIDLVSVWPKIEEGGWVGGDDFCRPIWQHGERYEPTLVFPFAVHFAEAVGAPIYALPHDQFLIEKTAERAHELVDLTGRYTRTDLRTLVAEKPARAGRSLAARVRRRVRR